MGSQLEPVYEENINRAGTDDKVQVDDKQEPQPLAGVKSHRISDMGALMASVS